MKAYLRFLSRNIAYMVANVVGLSVSLAFVIVIGLYAQMEFGRDRWHEKADRIYSLFVSDEDGERESSNWAMQPLLRSHFPEIENSCSAVNYNAELRLANQEEKVISVLIVDSTFFQLFDFPLTVGNRERALRNPHGMVLIEETARELFGESNPMGKDVVLNDTLHFAVTGVMPQLNHTYMAKADALISSDMADDLLGLSAYRSMANTYKDESMSSFGMCVVYLLAKEGVDLPSKLPQMNKLLSDRVWLFKPDEAMRSDLTMHPLTELYFMKRSDGSIGDRKQAGLLLLAGIVVLLFAVMNYVNLTIAQSGFRMREMAMRRLLGSQRWQVAGRLVTESIMLCFLSLAIAVLLLYLVEPAINWMLSNEHGGALVWGGTIEFRRMDIVQMADLWRPQNLLVLIGFTLLLGCVAGMIPAFVTSSAKPIEVVRGTFRRQTKMLFSRIFIILQHVGTIVFVAVALVMWLQIRHMINAPLGYDTDRLLVIQPNRWDQENKMERLYTELGKLANVEAISIGNVTPLSGGSNQTETLGNRTISFQTFRWSEGWMRMMGIKILDDYGTHGKNGERWFVTRKALQLEKLPMNARSIQLNGSQQQIDGIISDFRLGTVLEDYNRPIVIRETAAKPSFTIMLKYNGSLTTIRQQVKTIYESIFQLPMEFRNCVTYEELHADCFTDQLRHLRMVSVFAGVTLTVSLLGLLAMSVYFLQQRRKDIAVRKVFGSTSGEALVLLLRQFVVYVLIAFIVAVPIIYYIGQDWLSQFNYRISLSPWIYTVAGIASVAFSLFAVMIQSWQAANENPIKNIKTE